MRIAVVGGGPAGLAVALFARLLGEPDDVTVWERRGGDDTYGFGVILPSAALATLRGADPRLADALAGHLVSWDRITVRRGERPFSAPAPRLGAVDRRVLLRELRLRCVESGVLLHQGSEAPDVHRLAAEYDLVVAADGARSAVRGARADAFGTTLERLDPHYTWLGADRAFNELTFLVADTGRGPVTAHTYPYGPGRSTFLVEAAHTPDTAEVARLFSEPLRGARLLHNGSRWERFPQVTNARWADGNVVLVGDAAHTAHYSIGSGTRLALDDALALVTAVRTEAGLDAALAAFEAGRRPAVEHAQRVGRASAAWFTGLGPPSGAAPDRLLVDLVTRGGRISMADLAADGEMPRPVGGVGHRM